MWGFDRMVPHIHPELLKKEPGTEFKKTSRYLLFGIFLHNFPEGMAIGVGSVSDTKLSVLIAMALAAAVTTAVSCASPWLLKLS